MRVLIVSHAHPRRIAGGAQLVAHQLHRELGRCPGVDSYLLAHAGAGDVRLATFSSFERDGREILFHAGPLNPLLFSQQNTWFVSHDFRELLDHVAPDVVHFQHYAAVGVDLMREVRNWSAKVPMVLTLHEFLAMCHAGGQMVKNKKTFELCHRAEPRACAGCFPEISPEDFFLRELFIKSHFALVDRFIAPSEFLKGRYVDWGLAAEKIDVLENGQAVVAPKKSIEQGRPGSTHFAFFGKVFRAKGVLVLLEAIELLPPEVLARCDFSIYGSGVEEEPYQVRNEFTARLGRLSKHVRAYGAYAPEEQGSLMARVDWVVVPSIWWENSPMVIQEAFAHGVPVICSNIGGMAEKVTDGVNGLHCRANDPREWARVIARAASTGGLRETMAAGIRRPPTIAESAARHVALYERLVKDRAGPTAAAHGETASTHEYAE